MENEHLTRASDAKEAITMAIPEMHSIWYFADKSFYEVDYRSSLADIMKDLERAGMIFVYREE